MEYLDKLESERPYPFLKPIKRKLGSNGYNTHSLHRIPGEKNPSGMACILHTFIMKEAIS